MLSEAMTREPIAAWMGILNCWRGMSSLRRLQRARPEWKCVGGCYYFWREKKE